MIRWRDYAKPLPCGITAVTLTAAYLAGPARDAMDGATATAILIHMGLGIALVVPVAWRFLRAFRGPLEPARRFLLIAGAIFAGLCALFGIATMLRAALGQSAAREPNVGELHTLCGLAALLISALIVWRPRLRAVRTHGIAVPGALLLLLTQGGLFGAAMISPSYNADEYYRDLTATTSDQAQNPLFPSGIRLESPVGGSDRDAAFQATPSSRSCGERGCHESAYREWYASAHHFAGTDPFYRASAAESARRSDSATQRWCQGCHAPDVAIRRTIDTSYAQDVRSGEEEGVGCYACHAVSGTPARTGNGRFTLAAPQDYPFGTSRGWRRGLHDFLLRVRPGPHQRAYLKPALHRSAEFCSACHRQSMTVAQNHYQFVRGPDEYGEWARSPFSGRTARSAGVTPPQTCQDCHFRRDESGGMARRVSHLAPGANTALAELQSDSVLTTAIADRLRGSVSLDIFALRPSGAPAAFEGWIAPLDRPRSRYLLRAGDSWLLDVVARNVGVGHNFPAGYPDLTEAWVEVTVRDAAGRTILSNGVLDNSSSVAPRDAHVYGALLLDRSGNVIIHHTLADQVTTAYQRSIGAGESDVARYRFVIPKTAQEGPGKRAGLVITARLLVRSVRPDYAAWAIHRSGHGPPAAAAPIAPAVTVLAETSVTIPLQSAPISEPGESADTAGKTADRFEAYGTGLLASPDKPDIAGAIASFRQSGQLTPNRPAPWVALGRAYLREPDLNLAAQNFERALQCAPGSAAALSELSVVYNRQGQSDRAVRALTPLVESYPNDAALRYDLGLAQFRAGRYPEATNSFRSALAIDPDQYSAHFQLKRCYEVMRRVPEARREDSITRYMGEDRAASLLVPAFLAAHPAEARRAVSFPVHALR